MTEALLKMAEIAEQSNVKSQFIVVEKKEQDILDAWQKNMDEWIFEGINACITTKKE
jgi:hypothetical protein